MSIYEHLLKIVEQTSFSSANNKIAEYLLLHYDNISNLTVKDIAECSYVSKGTVSKFFQTMTMTGNFDCFQKACERESTDHKIYLKRREDTFLERSRKYKRKIISTKDLKILKTNILSAKKIILFSKMEFEGLSKEFTRRLLKFGIVAKTVSYSYDEILIEELSALSEDDLIIFMDADCSFYEHVLQMTYEIDIVSLMDKTKASSIVITQHSSNIGENNSFEEIVIQNCNTKDSELDVYKCLYTEILQALN